MVFRNKNFTKRDYEATNIVACVSEKQPNMVGWIPNDAWIPADESTLSGLTHLETVAGIQYWGWL